MSESPTSSSSSSTSMPRLPTPPSPIPSSSHLRPSRPRGASINTARSYSHSSTRDLSDWEIEELEEIHRAGGRGRKRNEPTSPLKAVLYVVSLYLIFQILTRSDELDIFPSSNPSTSSIRQSHSPPSSMEVPSYPHLPYGFPPIPNPIPSALPPQPGTSWWRLFFGVLLYPVYLLATILTTPLPLILNILYLLKELLKIILYPILVVLYALYGTFIAAPLGVVRRVLEAFYPLVVFIGGLVGVGCTLGLGVGWIGRWVLDSILNWKNRRQAESKLRRREKMERDRDMKDLRRIREAEIDFELERLHDRFIPKTPTSTSQSHSSKARMISSVGGRRPVLNLNIGTTNIRGTKKDERRQQDLQSQSQSQRRKSVSSSESERLTTPTASSSGSGSGSRGGGIGTGKRDRRIETFDTTYTTSTGIGTGNRNSNKKKDGRRLSFQDQDNFESMGIGSSREPMVVGIRKRGVRETYTVHG
ncbi:hypothetical protein I203_106408 [Kwoniella mangroviensis CBS 8507]|uniref:uncharacterized protein n=1 Tax=Kwoniella mangroviensis CBS 8507 TaxID=1296122 RepID=UPI00306D79BA